jgi:hypothetical protein
MSEAPEGHAGPVQALPSADTQAATLVAPNENGVAVAQADGALPGSRSAHEPCTSEDAPINAASQAQQELETDCKPPVDESAYPEAVTSASSGSACHAGLTHHDEEAPTVQDAPPEASSVGQDKSYLMSTGTMPKACLDGVCRALASIAGPVGKNIATVTHWGPHGLTCAEYTHASQQAVTLAFTPATHLGIRSLVSEHAEDAPGTAYSAPVYMNKPAAT